MTRGTVGSGLSASTTADGPASQTGAGSGRKSLGSATDGQMSAIDARGDHAEGAGLAERAGQAEPPVEGQVTTNTAANPAESATRASDEPLANQGESSHRPGAGGEQEVAASAPASSRADEADDVSPRPDDVSRGTTVEAVSLATPQSTEQTSTEARPRRSGRPQPISVADLGAAYPWTAGDEGGSSPDVAAVTDASDPEEAAVAAVHAGGLRNGEQSGAVTSGGPETHGHSSDVANDVPDDERGTVEDLPDARPGADADLRHQSDAGDGDEARRAALVSSLPLPSEDTPVMAELQLDARRRIELRGRKFPRPEKTRVITVANQKGGVGKTTTTVNLAAALAQAGLQVLVLDNDPQGNASTALGIDHRAGTPSIYEVLVDGAPMHEAVQQSPEVPGLWCLPATIDLSGAEIELVSMVARETRLRSALDSYLEWRAAQGLEQIDYVFVDCPPSLGLLTVNAFVVAREVLIPIQCEYYALEGLSQLLKTIQLIQAHLNPELSVSTILLTMYDARTNLAQQVADEVRTHFPDRTLRTTVPRSVRISEAPSYGQTVMTYDGGSSGALAYLEAARELAERGAPGSAPSQSTDREPGASGSTAQEDQ